MAVYRRDRDAFRDVDAQCLYCGVKMRIADLVLNEGDEITCPSCRGKMRVKETWLTRWLAVEKMPTDEGAKTNDE